MLNSTALSIFFFFGRASAANVPLLILTKAGIGMAERKGSGDGDTHKVIP